MNPQLLKELADPRWAGRLFVLSGPSGSGKTVLVERLTASEPSVARAVTATTRAPAAGERDGVDYHFLSPGVFREWVDRGEFIEHVEFVGHCYGTPARSVLEPLKAGKSVVLVIDVEGAMKVKEMLPHAVTIFVRPPSLDELRRRISGRGRDTPEAIARRLDRARHELAFEDRYDRVVVNDRLDDAVEALREIVVHGR